MSTQTSSETKLQKLCSAISNGFFEVMGAEDSDFTSTAASENITPDGFIVAGSLRDYLLKHYEFNEACGLAICIGKAACHEIIKSFADDLQYQNVDFRLLPSRKKIDEAAKRITESVFSCFPATISLETESESLVFTYDGDQEEDRLSAFLIDGFLQSMLCDISGGHFFPIEVRSSDGNSKIIVSKKAVG